MLRRLFLLSLFVFLVGNVSFGNSIYTKEQIDRFSRVQYKIVQDGDGFKGVNNGLVSDYKVANTYSAPVEDWYNSVTTTLIGTLRNYYDLEGNGAPLQIWQDPATPDNIHVCYTFSAQETGWSDRTIQYFFSSDRGATWSAISNVPASGRSGFGTITGLSTGAALIACHTAIGANTSVRTIMFADAFPGLGSFNSLDPNLADANKYIWPRIAATDNVSNTIKYVFCTSTNGADSAFYQTGLSLTSGSFGAPKPMNASPAECYTVSNGTGNRIGIAYINDGTNDPANYGDIYAMESTDNGATFGAPTKIFDANFASDSLGGLRGISSCYKGSTFCVTFETIKQTTAGNFFPGAPSKIRFWSSGAASSVVVADSSNVPYAPYQGTNDVLGSIARPSIGVSSDGNTLFISMMVASASTGSTDTTSFGDIYLTSSGNGGSSWKRPKMVNGTSPRMDWRYASISPKNDVSGTNGYVNMMVQRDVVPGSNVNLANTATDAHPVFWRVAYTAPVGVNTISSVADNFSLSQNYPNPFNPSTTIRFSLPQASNVMLKVYSLNGQEVATVVNNQLVSSGVSEVSFNASNLASGLYFYTITAGNYKETKKMMLIK
ncbi:MAG: T9SS type A sorting domain-containing protein [Bacteroidetes bacterium]|nr:T9SS type A sorting domain-containing protein [Bacteroidota bacterium]